jgi:hypothetical protein
MFIGQTVRRQHAGGSEQNARDPQSDLHNALAQQLMFSR